MTDQLLVDVIESTIVVLNQNDYDTGPRPMAYAIAESLVDVSEAVWWCDEHKSAGSEPIDGYAICWYYGNTLALAPRTKIEPCRIVPKLLVAVSDD